MTKIFCAILSLAITISAQAELTNKQLLAADKAGREQAAVTYIAYKTGKYTGQQLAQAAVEIFKVQATNSDVEIKDDLTTFVQVAGTSWKKQLQILVQ